MRSRRRRVSTGNAKSLSSQLLGLSLFIMLLAFFIVLNAISNFEETKYKPITDSLNRAFAAKVDTRDVDEQPSIRQSEASVANEEGQELERLNKLFTARIPGADVAVNRSRGEMHVRLSYSALESAVSDIGQAPSRRAGALDEDTAFFLPMLISLIRNDRGGMPFRMDILLNTNDDIALMQNEDPEQLRRLADRATMIADRIQSAGLPMRLLSAGLQNGKDDMVDLLFRTHVPYNPDVVP